MFEEVFLRKRLLLDSLIPYGFKKQKSKYAFESDIMNGDFRLIVSITQAGGVDTSLVETETGEEYVLYKTNASGTFVGDVRSAIEKVLLDIADKCYEPAVFKTEQAMKLISYVREKYGDELEFLWTKFPDNAIWRRKDNEKWYGALLTLSKSKLDGRTEKTVEIVDLREQPDIIETLIDNEKYYPGWHMNKKSWYTIVLDNSVSDAELFERIDESYRLAKK